MALSIFESRRKKRDQMVAIDLGSRITKAVHLQRRGNGFALLRYAMLDAPLFEKVLSVEMLTEHLQSVSQALEAKNLPTALTLGVNDILVRHVDMPMMPQDDMRAVLKLNSKIYLQQDLTGYVFDCHSSLPAKNAGKSNEPAQQGGQAKQKVLVAGAKKQVVDDLSAATKNAGLIPDHIVPSVIGPVNAFEKALPEVFAKEVIALVDIGFKASSISILHEGDLVLNRVVAIGGDRLTGGLAENMNISYAEAEGIKIGMAHEVQNVLDPLIVPLGRELRASIDFFEHRHDRPIAQVFVSGGSARSEFVLQTLQRELQLECKTWNPATTLELALPPQQAAEIEHVTPDLTVAIGAALTAL